LSVEQKRQLIGPAHPQISVMRQCELLDLARSSLYYQPVPTSPDELHLMKLIDQAYTLRPFYGIRKMTEYLQTHGEVVNHKRVARLMRQMGIEAIYPRPRTTVPADNVRRYPYLLKEVTINAPNQVWSTDITYIRLQTGFIYLVAVIDWYSRYVLSWEISNTLDMQFCIDALEKALRIGHPQIFNTDQGSQFTSPAFTGILEREQIQISQDGKGRAFDNIFVERLWRTVKYEEVYLKDYANLTEAYYSLKDYFIFYNQERFHQSLGYKTPVAIHFEQEVNIRK
jgi:putative transposase